MPPWVICPEAHSKFLPDGLFDGLRNAFLCPQRQKLDFAVVGPKIIKGLVSLTIGFLDFLSPPLKTLEFFPPPMEFYNGECPREDMP